MYFIRYQPFNPSGIAFGQLYVYIMAWIWLISLFASPVYGARPMVTDDASIVDAKACQLESWAQINHGNTEYWALPACNFTGNLELTFGGAHNTNDQKDYWVSNLVLQGKTLFKPLETNSWGVGVAFGNEHYLDRNTYRNSIGDLYAYVPASFSFVDDRFVLHLNLGWLHKEKNKRHRLTWGIGSETQLSKRTWLIAETFGHEQGKLFYQLGFRHWLILDLIQIDTTYGSRFDSGAQERWFTIGLRLLTTPFLP